jgi:ABC-type multidrug transport system fused ATPase/permease subunit
LPNFRAKISESTLGRSISVLDRVDRNKLSLMVVLQIVLSLLDLIAVAIIGLIGAIGVNGVKSSSPSPRITQILEYLRIENQTIQVQVGLLGIFAATLLVGRTLFSIFAIRRMLFFLSRRGAAISSHLFSRVLAQPLMQIQYRSTQELLYAVTSGVSVVTLGVIGTSIGMISDAALLVLLTLALLYVDPLMALGSIAFFIGVAFLLYKNMSSKAHQLGILNSKNTISSNVLTLESLSAYRELFVSNRRSSYVNRFTELRFKSADILAEISFLPNVSKYVIESVVIIGAVLLGATQFLLQDATSAVATLSVFLAAGSRIAPAVLRIQQGAVSVRGAIGSAKLTLDLIQSVEKVVPVPGLSGDIDFSHAGFEGTVKVKELNFSYIDNTEFNLQGVSFEVQDGSTIALVGPSGCGKSTLVDAIMGIIETKPGSVLISGKRPSEAIAIWPGAISYVPQEVLISDETIRANVALGYSEDEISDAQIWRALEFAQLGEFVRALPLQLATRVGERGAKLSGGQRQRIGIARAILTQPRLLVLDEATSTLDSQTEFDISESISKLKGRTTILMIAHRLATVKNADTILYIENGQILAHGTLSEVRKLAPNFDRQAKLLGI